MTGRIQPARRPSSTFPTRPYATHCKQSGFKSFSFHTYRQFRASPSLPGRPRRRPARLFCCCNLSSLTPLFTTLISKFRVLAEIDRNCRPVTSLFATHPKNASVSPLLATHFQKHRGLRQPHESPVCLIPKIDRKRCPRGQSTRLYGNGSRVPFAAANRLAKMGRAPIDPTCGYVSRFSGLPGCGSGTLDLRGRGSGFVLSKPRDESRGSGFVLTKPRYERDGFATVLSGDQSRVV